ncbi:GGDEF domain-containing protein [Martelella mangrovi]
MMQALIVPGGLLILAGSFIVAWFTGVRRLYLILLAGSYGMLAVGFCAMMLRGLLPDAFILPVANGLFIATQIGLAEALLQRRGKSFGIAVNMAVFLITFAIYCYFLFFGSTFERTLAINVALFLIMFVTMLRFWIRRDDTIHDKLIFWTIVALGLAHSVRSIGIFYSVDIVDPNSIFWQFMQVYILLLAMVLALEVLASHFVESLDRLNTLRDRDKLTGVLNREGFDRAVGGFYTDRSATLVAMTLLDLDNFKVTNDTLGHPAGDMVLRAFGEILRRETRATDVIGRIGGDEFAIFSVGLDRQGACVMAERIRNHLSQRWFSDAGMDFEATCSIGVATARSQEGYEALYRMADNALYGAKRLGRNRVVAEGAPSTVVRETSILAGC